MTNLEIIKKRLKKYKVELDDDELSSYLSENGLSGTDEFLPENGHHVKKSMASFIGSLLAIPAMSQGDFSRKFDVAGIKAYYSLLCRELGEPDLLNTSDNIVQDRSGLW